MLRSILKNFYLGSLFISLIISCSPALNYNHRGTAVITLSDIHSIINKDNSLLYKAKITLYNRYYSGLILLKQADTNTSHLVFITELGMKMFDFEIRHNQFKLIYVFEPLNKPGVLKVLEQDLKLLLLQNLLNKEVEVFGQKVQSKLIYRIADHKLKNYYLVNPTTRTVNKIIVKGALFTKETVNYIYNDSLNAKQIKLKHKGIMPLKIELNNISTKLQQ